MLNNPNQVLTAITRNKNFNVYKEYVEEISKSCKSYYKERQELNSRQNTKLRLLMSNCNMLALLISQETGIDLDEVKASLPTPELDWTGTKSNEERVGTTVC